MPRLKHTSLFKYSSFEYTFWRLYLSEFLHTAMDVIDHKRFGEPLQYVGEQDPEVLCFGPGLPPTGAQGRARFVKESLVIKVDSREVCIPASTIDITVGGFDSQQLHIRAKLDGAEFSLIPTKEPDCELLLSQAPPSLTASVNAWRRQRRTDNRRCRIYGSLLALLIIAPVLLLGLFLWKLPLVSNLVLANISIETEKQLSTLVKSQHESKFIDSGPAVDALRAIGSRLTAGSQYQYEWYVSQESTINAFAAPGGLVVVNAGLIRFAESPEELAGVLAHEVQHVELRHSLRSIVNQLGVGALWTILIGDLNGWGTIAEKLLKLSFSRTQEAEADRLGLLALKNAQISPTGMITFFSKLDAQGGKLPAFISTHPSDASRMDALRAELVTLGEWKTEPIALSWREIQASLP